MKDLQSGTDYGKVGSLLDRLVSSGQLPGASVLIHQSGEEAYYYQAGLRDVAGEKPVERDTLFCLYSMTKPVTAAAVMILVDDGVLRLDDPVADYIPELADLAVYVGEDGDTVRTEPARPILVRHLLTHTAGFSYWFYPDQPVAALYAKDQRINDERWRFDAALGGEDGLVQSLTQLPLVAQPGSRWHYSMSLEVAGVVIERATGDRLDTFMARRILEHLGMADTIFRVAPDQAGRLASVYKPKEGGGFDLMLSAGDNPVLKEVAGFAGGGGLVSTIDDFARFAEMLAGGGAYGGRRVLSEASAREMMSDQLAPDQLAELPGLAAWGLGGAGDGLGYGLGGAVVLRPPGNGVPAFKGEYSWGGAASTTFWVDPENQLTVVFMTQLQPPVADIPRDSLHRTVYAALNLTNDGDD